MPSEAPKEEITLAQFLDSVAGPGATPGGGSVSALAGSLGAALVEMVINLTMGKKGFEGKEAELKRIREEAHSYREALTGTIAEDSLAYQSVMNAFLLPKKTEEEKGKRKEEIQRALKKAADPPLFTTATSLEGDEALPGSGGKRKPQRHQRCRRGRPSGRCGHGRRDLQRSDQPFGPRR